MQNKTIQVILDRVSCKSYSDKKVSVNKIKQIAECGKNAPSGMNRQICTITVVNTKRNVEKLRELSKEKLNRDCFYNAQTMILVHAPQDEKHCVTDSSCVLENMFIGATALKVGSCWINQVDELFNTPEGSKLKKKFNIPSDHKVVGTCVVGYPSEGYTPKAKPRKEDFIKYI